LKKGRKKLRMLSMKQDNLQYVTNQAGEKTAVILPISEFEELLEDLQDLAVVAERRDEASISHEELLAELKRDGLLQS
jgi:hypothetical protein